MAHYFLFPLKDSCIYEDFTQQNSGLDAIIEIEKQLVTATGEPLNSRILIQFDLDSFSCTNFICPISLLNNFSLKDSKKYPLSSTKILGSIITTSGS